MTIHTGAKPKESAKVAFNMSLACATAGLRFLPKPLLLLLESQWKVIQGRMSLQFVIVVHCLIMFFTRKCSTEMLGL